MKKIKRNRKRNISLVLTILFLFLIINIFNYITNFNFYKAAPSKKWSKSRALGEIKATSNSKIVPVGKNYIIAANNDKSIKLLKVNNRGDILEKCKLDIDTEILNSLDILTLKDNKVYIQWSSIKLEGVKVNGTVLDDKFNVLSKNNEKMMKDTSRLDEKLMLFAYKDKIEVKDINMGKINTLKVNDPDFVRGIKLKENEYCIVYRDKEKNLIKVMYKDGNFQKPVKICTLVELSGEILKNITFGTDLNQGYLIIEKQNKQGIKSELISFNLNDKKEELYSTLKLKGVSNIGEVVFNKVKDNKAYFLAVGDRRIGVKKTFNDVFEFYIQNNQPVLGDFISRSPELVAFEGAVDDIVIYSEYDPDKGEYSLRFTSSNEEFKKENNRPKNKERKQALLETIEIAIYGIAYTFILGLKWILPDVLILTVLSFIQDKLSKKGKVITFTILAFIIAAFKSMNIYQIIYANPIAYLPKALSYSFIGMGISILISIICYIYAYLFYKEDMDSMYVMIFSPFLVLDSILTFILFAQYLL